MCCCRPAANGGQSMKTDDGNYLQKMGFTNKPTGCPKKSVPLPVKLTSKGTLSLERPVQNLIKFEWIHS